MTAFGDPELEIKVRERELLELQAAYKTTIPFEKLKKASSVQEAEAAPSAQGDYLDKVTLMSRGEKQATSPEQSNEANSAGCHIRMSFESRREAKKDYFDMTCLTCGHKGICR